MVIRIRKFTLKITEGAIRKKGNPEELATNGTQDEEKQNKTQHTICVGHHYMQTNTNNVNKTWALLQTTGVKERRFYAEIVTDITAGSSERKDT